MSANVTYVSTLSRDASNADNRSEAPHREESRALMNGAQKFSLSLLISVVLFAVAAVLFYPGDDVIHYTGVLADRVERLYSRRVEESVQKDMDAIVSAHPSQPHVIIVDEGDRGLTAGPGRPAVLLRHL